MTLLGIGLVVLLVFVVIFAVYAPYQQAQQRRIDREAAKAFSDGYQRASDVHGYGASSQGAGDEWLKNHAHRSAWAKGVEKVSLASAWEEGYRAAVRAKGGTMTGDDANQLASNPYSGH